MRKVILLFSMICTLFVFLWFNYGKDNQVITTLEQCKSNQKLNSNPALKPDINFGKIPLYFISNEGQVHKQAKFYAKASRYTLWLTKEGLVFDSAKRSEVRGQKSEGIYKAAHQINKSTNKQGHERDVSRLIFIGSNENPKIFPINEKKLRVNYFKGNDPSKWVGHIPTSQAVLYKDLYKNIDLKVYGIEKQIEYDWIVKPGGNPEDIRFEYKSVKKTKINKEGNLIITTKFGELIHKKPISYQEVSVGADLCVRPPDNTNGKRIPVNSTFIKVGKNTYGFEVGDYDKSRVLIIDPVVLAYSTYLGGGSIEDGYGIAIDSSGYVYVTGSTTSTNFPCLNQYQGDQADTDVFVTKLDPFQSGASSLLYSTYLGGGNSELGYGIAVDNNGNAYVTGYTNSTDFPTLNQYQSDQGSYDAFITKLDTNQSGTASLLYSTYLGGGSEDYGYGIAVDSSGYVYVTGHTDSTDFPTLNQYQADQVGYDAFVTKLDTTQSGSSSFLYSTYLGGGSSDSGRGIAVDSSGSAYVTGYTDSTDFPTLNHYMWDPGDGYPDVFITKLDTTQNGTSCLLYSTYLGGGSEDYGYGIAVDSSGSAYVTGFTLSTDFPTLNQYQADQGSYDAFVTKLDTTESGTDSLLYSTYLGGSLSDYGRGITLGNTGIVYVVGTTESTDFPILNEYMWDPGDGYTVTFVTKLDTNQSAASSLLYSTYLGGDDYEEGYGIAVDSNGNAYVTGYTYSTDFPTLNQFMSYQGSSDAFVTKLIDYTYPHPFVFTKAISSITATYASSGGIVVSGGDSSVTTRGICWSTSPHPTIWDDYTTDGSGLGEYTSSLTALTPETNYYVRAYASNYEGLDYGEEIQFTTLPVSITVTSPNGGETWCTGTSQTINWTPDGVTNPLYIILQQNDTNIALIGKGIDPSLGAYAWTVGDCRLGTANAGVNYKILLKVKNSTVKDKSDAVFTIVDPYVSVTSPNGGEDWQIGTTENITWDSAGLTSTLLIVLQQNGTNVALIAKNVTPSLGTYSWTVGDCIKGSVTTGPNHKILIAVTGSSIKDKSDADFTISN
jgi:hypothetical protein